MIAEPAPAKINLALHVRRRRADGYHDVETLFAFCRDGDMVSVAEAETPSFEITGPFASALSTSSDAGAAPGVGDNLVVRAERAFNHSFARRAVHTIILDKRLPVASGIGGGSADAAATLRALARLHGIAADHPELHGIAARLGADVPACLAGRTALGTGRGDVLEPLAGLSGTPVLLVNPGVAVATAMVFAGWDGRDRGAIAQGALLDRAAAGRNDLEPPARILAPAIDGVLADLSGQDGVLLSRMSGSGATCFALFADTAARDRARDRVDGRGRWTLPTDLA